MSLISPSHETMRLAAEAEKRIQSVAHPPRRDGKQPAGEAYSSRRTPLAAPFPHPHANPSLRAATQAMSAVTRVPPSSIDPAFLAAWRETQYGPNDMEAR